MSYSKGYENGYKAGFDHAFDLVMNKFNYAIEFSGVVRKKQFNLISDELSKQKEEHKIPSPTCVYNGGWDGKCKNTNLLANGQCEAHQKKCIRCDQVATQNCGFCHSYGVCGARLCDDCIGAHYDWHYAN